MLTAGAAASMLYHPITCPGSRRQPPDPATAQQHGPASAHLKARGTARVAASRATAPPPLPPLLSAAAPAAAGRHGGQCMS